MAKNASTDPAKASRAGLPPSLKLKGLVRSASPPANTNTPTTSTSASPNNSVTLIARLSLTDSEMPRKLIQASTTTNTKAATRSGTETTVRSSSKK